MSGNKPNGQKIVSGEKSNNVQVGRDYHIHQAPKASPILRPSQTEIENFDPRFRQIRDAADKEVRNDKLWTIPRRNRRGLAQDSSALFIGFLGLAITLLIFLLK